MSPTARGTRGRASLEVELERDGLLPGRLVAGRVRLDLGEAVDARGLLVTLTGTESWQYEVTERGPDNQTRRRTVTATEVLRRVPVQLLPPGRLEPGVRELPFELPVPPLGPASLSATVSRLDWVVEAKLDQPRSSDLRAELPVRVLQPTALLRAGVVRVGQFALWEAADAQHRGARASIELRPVPLCLGAPFEARVGLELEGAMRLQGIRLELRVKVRATVSSGRAEELTVWSGPLADGGQLGAGRHELSIAATLPAVDLATIELPHGESDAELHLILDRRLAPDPHLVRDVAICTTLEL